MRIFSLANGAGVFFLLGITLLGLPGCASVSFPDDKISPEIEAESLARDVNFFAQPALKGRPSRTKESKIVREYIERRFEKYGLVPWPDTNSYEQPFMLGTNVIGVLPGSDANLAGQIVIISAHYDHRMPWEKGIDLGACDNASGLSALMEIAEHISLNQRPRRSIAFAAFDCEEYCAMGSFAFTCSEHFDPNKIAAVINVDMLGRDFFGVVPKALFVVGTESYPNIREHIITKADSTAIKVLPIGTQFVGPVGDHIPFEPMNMPVMFFTCGFNPDYHKPTDTVDKLNFADIKDSAIIVADTLSYLANAERIEKPQSPRPMQKHELETLDYVFRMAYANKDRIKNFPKQALSLDKLAHRTGELLTKGSYSWNDCRELMSDIISPTIVMAGPDFKMDPNMMACVESIYASHRIFLIEQVRGFVKSALKDKPSVFGKIKYANDAYDLTDDLINFTPARDGQYELYVLLPKIKFVYENSGWPFFQGKFDLLYLLEPLHCSGSTEQINDYCLLKWKQDVNNPTLSKAYHKILQIVNSIDGDFAYDQWLDMRLTQAKLADEHQWISICIQNDNSDVANLATYVSQQIAAKAGKFEKLLPLVEDLSNETPNPKNYICDRFFEQSGPFAEHPCFLHNCQDPNKPSKYLVNRTPADTALEKLKRLTGQKFGKDKNAWRKWIESNTKETVISRKNTDFVKSS